MKGRGRRHREKKKEAEYYDDEIVTRVNNHGKDMIETEREKEHLVKICKINVKYNEGKSNS